MGDTLSFGKIGYTGGENRVAGRSRFFKKGRADTMCMHFLIFRKGSGPNHRNLHFLVLVPVAMNSQNAFHNILFMNSQARIAWGQGGGGNAPQ